MALCKSCGTQLNDDVQFCPACGTNQEAAPAPEAAPQAPTYQQPPVQQGYQPPVVPGAPAMNDIQDAEQNKTMGILSYVLFFIPLLTGAHKTSPFVHFHVNQGTVLWICCIIYSVALSILQIPLLFIPFLGAILVTVLWLVPIGFTVLAIIGILNVVNGRCKPLPIIGQYTIIK